MSGGMRFGIPNFTEEECFLLFFQGAEVQLPHHACRGSNSLLSTALPSFDVSHCRVAQCVFEGSLSSRIVGGRVLPARESPSQSVSTKCILYTFCIVFIIESTLDSRHHVGLDDLCLGPAYHLADGYQRF